MSLTLHTTLGPITIELFCNIAPISCYHFLALAASGGYTNTIFFSITEACLHGGDATNTGKAGQTLYPSDIMPSLPDEISSSLSHNKRGIVSLLNKFNQHNTSRSQFYITLGPCEELDSEHTIIGNVVSGWQTLDLCEKTPVQDKNYRPITPVIIESVEIHCNPFANGELNTPQFFLEAQLKYEHSHNLNNDESK